jgi:hypothetical protein
MNGQPLAMQSACCLLTSLREDSGIQTPPLCHLFATNDALITQGPLNVEEFPHHDLAYCSCAERLFTAVKPC